MRDHTDSEPAPARWRARTWLWLVLLCLLYAATRAPLLTAGFGVDTDAWLTARAADATVAARRYVPSRMPGFPTSDLGFAATFAIFGSSYQVGNATAAAVGLVGVLLLVAIGRRLDLRQPLLPAAALALQPEFWVASTTTIETVWGATLIIGMVERLLAGAPLVAGILLGLAVGARLTNALVALPVALWLLLTGRPRRSVARFAGAAVVCSGALYSPMFIHYGLKFLHLGSLRRDYLSSTYWVFQWYSGVPFAITLTVAVLIALRMAHSRSGSEPRRDGALVLFVGIIIALFVQWFVIPYDPSHLLPVAPLMALLIARYLPPKTAVVVLLAWVLPSLVTIGELDVNTFHKRHALQLRLVGPGLVVQDHAQRMSDIVVARRLASARLPAGSCIVVGPPVWPLQRQLAIPPREWQERFDQADDDIVFLRILRPEWLPGIVGKRPIRYVEGQDMPYYTRRVFGYSLEAVGAEPLKLGPPKN